MDAVKDTGVVAIGAGQTAMSKGEDVSYRTTYPGQDAYKDVRIHFFLPNECFVLNIPFSIQIDSFFKAVKNCPPVQSSTITSDTSLSCHRRPFVGTCWRSCCCVSLGPFARRVVGKFGQCTENVPENHDLKAYFSYLLREACEEEPWGARLCEEAKEKKDLKCFLIIYSTQIATKVGHR